LAHYFDVILERGTVGLMTIILAISNSTNSNHSLFTPLEVIDFHKKYSEDILL